MREQVLPAAGRLPDKAGGEPEEVGRADRVEGGGGLEQGGRGDAVGCLHRQAGGRPSAVAETDEVRALHPQAVEGLDDAVDDGLEVGDG